MVKLGPEMVEAGYRPLMKDIEILHAHAGKDETPYPVHRRTYDQTIATLAEAVRHSRTAPKDKDTALKRLTEASQES
jgi:hypothetical protein